MVLVKKNKIECPVRYELGKVDRWRVVSCFYMRFGYHRLKVDPGASFLVFSVFVESFPHIIINNN